MSDGAFAILLNSDSSSFLLNILFAHLTELSIFLDIVCIHLAAVLACDSYDFHALIQYSAAVCSFCISCLFGIFCGFLKNVASVLQAIASPHFHFITLEPASFISFCVTLGCI
jgi:hypothetical protein